MIGQTLSHYKIIEKLGAGGQGEVYLAEDSRLDRKVALKILPQHLSDKAELRERFEREARAVSSLNHPHICTLYDIGEQDGIHYLVMEHLVGETLEARLAKGALPLEQTLEHAIQIADALDKAHRQGVVHRDLKPGNIMLVKSGAKLLDFGLAKLQAADTPTNLSALPTEQANLTAEGTILGTLQYMAPEQLEGKEADSRTDIFAFGAVVYEMATGKKALEGKSQASLIAAILKDDPRPMVELQPMAPRLLDHVVARCLAKDPDDRWQSSSDITHEMRWIVGTGSDERSVLQASGSPRSLRLLGWIAATFLVSTILTSLVVWSLLGPGSAAPPSVTRFEVTHPESDVITFDGGFALSPDGERLVYAATRDQVRQLFVRARDEVEATPIRGTEDATHPFFSPDGNEVGFFASNALKKVSLSSGSVMTLASVGFRRGGSWGANNTIVFASDAGPGLMRISAAGGEPEPLTVPADEGERYNWPEFLPDGKAVLFTISQQGPISEKQISVLSLETLTHHVLEDGTDAHFASSGHLVFARAGSLWAAPFDPESLELTGEPTLMLEGVRVNSGGGWAFYTLAN